jgi:hypothetical protein
MLEMWLITAVSCSSTKIDPLPALPVVPTVDLLQPTCGVQTGTIRITLKITFSSIGAGYQNSPEFKNLAPGDYTMSVRFTNSIACISVGSKITVKLFLLKFNLRVWEIVSVRNI